VLTESVNGSVPFTFVSVVRVVQESRFEEA
jgi:hypothetical protein